MAYFDDVTKFVQNFITEYPPDFEKLKKEYPDLTRLIHRLSLSFSKNGLELKASFSNTKLGPTIPSISLLPVITCPGAQEAKCIESCYAIASYGYRPGVLVNHILNTYLYYTNKDKFWFDLETLFRKRSITTIRMFEGGDIPDQNFLNNLNFLCRKYKDKKVFVYTKSIYLNYEGIPRNLFVLFSIMQNSTIRYKANAAKLARENGFMIAYAGNKKPLGKVIACPNQIDKDIKCQDCGICFNSVYKGKVDITVWFKPHGANRGKV